MTRYDDIINHEHHVSRTRPQMSMINRAAQFAPFAALVGYDDEVIEAARLTEEKIELSEEKTAQINAVLQDIQRRITEKPQIIVTYFRKDEKKAGGCYLPLSGAVKKLDLYTKKLHMESGEEIDFEDIADISLESNVP